MEKLNNLTKNKKTKKILKKLLTHIGWSDNIYEHTPRGDGRRQIDL